MPGILHCKRLFAGLCAVAAMVTAAPAPAARQATIAPEAVGPTTVSFSFPTGLPTKAMLSMSKDTSYALKLADGRKKLHKFKVTSLKPDTGYNCTIEAFYPTGRKVSSTCNFKTKARSAGTVSVRGNKLLLDGSPFFPVLSFGYECMTDDFVKFSLGLRIDALMDTSGCSGEPSTWTPYLNDVLQGRLWMVQRQPQFEEAIADLPELLRWPAEVEFNGRLAVGSCNNPADDKAVVRYFDLFKKAASSRPTIFRAAIYTPFGSGQQNCFNRPSMEAMLMEASIAGAAGFELETTLVWNRKAGAQVKPELGAASRTVIDRLASIMPALHGGQNLNVRTTNRDLVLVGKKYAGVMYVLAVNTNRHSTAKTTFQLPATTGRMAAVVWGGRSIKLRGAAFTDNLPPLAYRLYVVAPLMQ